MKLLKQLHVCERKQLQFQITVQSKQPFYRTKFNNTLRNNWKLLFEVFFSKNSTKAIVLFA